MLDYFLQAQVPNSKSWFNNHCTLNAKTRASKAKANSTVCLNGFLWKMSGHPRKWKKRFFEFDSDSKLKYYKSTAKLSAAYEAYKEHMRSEIPNDAIRIHFNKLKSTLLKSTLDLGAGTNISIPESNEATYKTPYVFEIMTCERVLVLCCSSIDQRNAWMQSIHLRIF